MNLIHKYKVWKCKRENELYKKLTSIKWVRAHRNYDELLYVPYRGEELLVELIFGSALVYLTKHRRYVPYDHLVWAKSGMSDDREFFAVEEPLTLEKPLQTALFEYFKEMYDKELAAEEEKGRKDTYNKLKDIL